MFLAPSQRRATAADCLKHPWLAKADVPDTGAVIGAASKDSTPSSSPAAEKVPEGPAGAPSTEKCGGVEGEQAPAAVVVD
jgi:hypothetical protein